MAKPIAERLAEAGKPSTPAVEQAERLSRRLRAKRPLPATRQAADELFKPRSGIAHQRATIPRLARLSRLGVIRWTNAEAHEAILDAMYDEDGNLRLDIEP